MWHDNLACSTAVLSGTLKEQFADRLIAMYRQPPLELLESYHTFPGPYIFKVIGKADGGFMARTVAAVREELALDVDPPFKVREAKGGRHIAVTLEPHVQSAAQVLAIYRRLQAMVGLVMLW